MSTITCIGRLYNGSKVTDYVLREDSTGRSKTVSANEVKTKMKAGILQVTNLRLYKDKVITYYETSEAQKINRFGQAMTFLSEISVESLDEYREVYRKLRVELDINDDKASLKGEELRKKISKAFVIMAKKDRKLANEKVNTLFCGNYAYMIEMNLESEIHQGVNSLQKSKTFRAVKDIAESGVVEDESAVEGVEIMLNKLKWHDMECGCRAHEICEYLEDYCDLKVFKKMTMGLMLTEGNSASSRLGENYQFEYNKKLRCCEGNFSNWVVIKILFSSSYADICAVYINNDGEHKYRKPVRVELGQCKSYIDAAKTLASTYNKIAKIESGKYILLRGN